MKNIIKLIELSNSRMKELIETKHPWYKGHSNYIDGIKEELEEVIQEIKENNKVYLEDELGDLFWSYICLLSSLEQEGKIEVKNVFKRSYKKFSERIGGVRSGKTWAELKEKQKKKLEKEHKKIYN